MCQSIDEYRIVTERLVLRTLRMTDAEQVAALCNNKNLYESTLHLPFPYAVADAKVGSLTRQRIRIDGRSQQRIQRE